MSATEKTMDQQFAAMDQMIAEDAPDLDNLDETSDANLDKIDALLAGDDNDDKAQDQDNDEESTPDDSKDEEQESDTTEENADESDDEDNADTVDYDQEIEVPMPDHMETMTVGKLKDAEVNRQERERKIDKNHAENLENKYQLDSIIATLSARGELPPETARAIQEQKRITTIRENQATLEAIPEWEDQKVFVRDHKEITNLAARFGYTANDVKAAVDHRHIHMARAFVKTVEELNELKAKVSGAKPRPNRKISRRKTGRKVAKLSGNKTDKLVKAASESTDQRFKDAAIAKLLE